MSVYISLLVPNPFVKQENETENLVIVPKINPKALDGINENDGRARK